MNEPTGMLKIANLISVSETAKMLGVSRPTLYRWMKDETMNFPSPVQAGNRTGFREDDIRKWVKIIQG